MTTRIDFSQNIPKMVPASKLDEIKENMLNCFNKEDVIDDNLTDYDGSDDELDFLGNMSNDNFNTFCNVLEQKINEKENNENKTFSQNNKKESHDDVNNVESNNSSDSENVDDVHEVFQDEIYDYVNNLQEIDIKDILDYILKKRNINIIHEKDFPKINLSPKEEIIKMISYNVGNNVNIYSFMFAFITLFSLNKRSGSPLTLDIKFYIDYYNILFKDKKINDNIFNLSKLPKIQKSENIKIRKFDINLLSFRMQFYKYNKIKNKFYNNIKNFHNLYNKHKEEYKKSMELFDTIEKEVEEDIKKEKEEQLNIQMKKIYEKLKENNNIELKEDNNIYKLINKLEKQKVEKLYILSDIGKELKDQNIENETKFLEQFKDNDIYYIYDLKNKNKISRFINMCNKLYLLKDKINLDNIIKNKLLTSIRDLSQNNFTYLLNLF
jgi:hypothetical protein